MTTLDTAFYDSLRQKHGELPAHGRLHRVVPHERRPPARIPRRRSELLERRRLHRPVNVHPAWEGSGNEDMPQRLGVMAPPVRGGDGRVPCTSISSRTPTHRALAPYDCLDMSLHLTADEAERLAKALLEKAELVRNQTD